MAASCEAPGCTKKLHARGFCQKHYSQLRRHGRLAPEKERSGIQPVCKAPGCDLRNYCHGYCQKHYQQVKVHGRLTPEREHFQWKACSIDGCHERVRSNGMCSYHYHRAWRIERGQQAA